jgi:hypothetical protein
MLCMLQMCCAQFALATVSTAWTQHSALLHVLGEGGVSLAVCQVRVHLYRFSFSKPISTLHRPTHFPCLWLLFPCLCQIALYPLAALQQQQQQQQSSCTSIDSSLADPAAQQWQSGDAGPCLPPMAVVRLPGKVSSIAWSPDMEGVLSVGDYDGTLTQVCGCCCCQLCCTAAGAVEALLWELV